MAMEPARLSSWESHPLDHTVSGRGTDLRRFFFRQNVVEISKYARDIQIDLIHACCFQEK
jgi:hypothetical protein